MFSLMNTLRTFAISASLVALAAMQPSVNAQATQPAEQPPAAQAGHPSGKLVIWGDIALFTPPTAPDNCILTNRFKKGQKVGFRMTAIDGGSGQIENTAVLVVHLTYGGGKKVEAPMRWRGAAGPAAPAPKGYLRSPVELWTGSWVVPDDAPTGAVSYTVTATDRFGRTASFTPFSAEASQLVVVQ